MQNPSIELQNELKLFFESFFPTPSMFELPRGVENPTLYLDEYLELKKNNKIKNGDEENDFFFVVENVIKVLQKKLFESSNAFKVFFSFFCKRFISSVGNKNHDDINERANFDDYDDDGNGYFANKKNVLQEQKNFIKKLNNDLLKFPKIEKNNNYLKIFNFSSIFFNDFMFIVALILVIFIVFIKKQKAKKVIEKKSKHRSRD
jgi:hypothetical protein